MQKFVDGAKKFGKKTKNVAVQITEEDFHNIQVKAIQKGVSYQTLLSSIIHEHLSSPAFLVNITQVTT